MKHFIHSGRPTYSYYYYHLLNTHVLKRADTQGINPLS